MSKISIIKINFDKKLNDEIESVQFDNNSRFIIFKLINNSKAYDLTGKTVRVAGIKRDGTEIFNDCEMVDEKNGMVSMELTEQINAAGGRVVCELKIYGDNDFLLSTKQFVINVSNSVMSTKILSSNEFAALTNALKEIHDIDKKFAEVSSQIDEKANKNEIFTMANMGQDVKEAMTGGSVAVVGKDTILTENIVDKQVTPIKTSFFECDLINILELNSSTYNGYNNNAPLKITYTSYDSIEVETNDMCGVFFKIATVIGKKYILKVKLLTNSSNANVRVYSSDKTTELIRTILSDGYYTGVFIATETETNIRFWCDKNFSVFEARVYEGEKSIETWNIKNEYIPLITDDKIESIGIDKASFLNKTIKGNLIDNRKINFTTESCDRFNVEINLEKTTYKLFCKDFGSNLYIRLKNSNGEILQTILNNTIFIGNDGLEFTSTVNGKCLLDIQIVNSSLLNTKGNWLLCNTQIMIGDLQQSIKYKSQDIEIATNNTDFIKSYNIKPKIWKNGQNINNDGKISPDDSKKWFHAEEILSDTYYYLSPNTINPVVFYDEKGNYISCLPISSVLNDNNIIIFKTPSNAKYVRGVANIDTDLSDMVFCPTLYKDRVSLLEANKPMINPSLFTQNHRKTRYEGKKLVTDGDSLVAMGRWQQRVVEHTGLILTKNCGVGGSKVTSMCSDERVAEIPEDTQVLILWAGTNDWGQTNNATPIGTIDDEHTNETYYGAYQLWLDKIKNKIPDALILICIQSHRDGENTPNHLGYTLEEYRIATRNIAYKYGIPTVDLKANMGVNDLNHYDYFEDVVHINDTKGAKKVSELIVGKLKEIEPFDI